MSAWPWLFTSATTLAGAVLVALLCDRLFGEPPARVHPVVAMGRYLGWVGARVAPRPGQPHRPWLVFVLGGLAWVLGATLVVAVAAGSVMLVHETPPVWQALLLGGLLKPLLAWRMLAEEVRAVEAALAVSLDAGRAQLARLVSRDTRRLSATEVREAAIETLAENLNDSVVAPLFWFAIAGLPGAAVYRFANTADAMWGYRDQREWSGKFAARADDLLSWIPARITALLMFPPLPALRREARRTPSPNSGWPMAAMALRLGLSLGKPGVYRLNAQGAAPQPADMPRALRLAQDAMLASAALLALAALILRWPA